MRTCDICGDEDNVEVYTIPATNPAEPNEETARCPDHPPGGPKPVDGNIDDLPDHRSYETLMGEYNPRIWEPPEVDDDSRSTVNIWDPVAETDVTVQGHWANRQPDMDRKHARKMAARGHFDGEHRLPLIESNMRTDPIEGTQGSYSRVIRLEDSCPECGSDYAVHSHHTMGGIHSEMCLICDYQIHQP